MKYNERDLSRTRSLQRHRTDRRSSTDLDRTSMEVVWGEFTLSSLEYIRPYISDSYESRRTWSLRCRIEEYNRAVAGCTQPVSWRRFLTTIKNVANTWWRSRPRLNDRLRHEQKSCVGRCSTIAVRGYRQIVLPRTVPRWVGGRTGNDYGRVHSRQRWRDLEEILSIQFQIIFASSSGRASSLFLVQLAAENSFRHTLGWNSAMILSEWAGNSDCSVDWAMVIEMLSFRPLLASMQLFQQI